MSIEAGVDSAAANLNLNPEEKRLYGQLFRQADTGNAGVVTGEVAVKFFDKTRLDSRVLGEIWQIADKENRGFLTPAGFGIVLRLIGHAQAGREPTPELAFQPGQLPRFDGFGPQPAALGSPQPPAALQPQGSGSAIRIPPLTPDKVAQYAAVFERQPLINNTLAGDQAKQIFEKSGLPNEILGRIWMLADTEQRGALVQTEFVIAMHLLTSMKTGALRALPNILPAPLYEAATRRGSPVAVAAPRQSPSNTGSGIPGVPGVIPRQTTGHAQPPGSPLGRPPIVAARAAGAGLGESDWVVNPADKVKFDQIFADLDKGAKGFITGEEAVPFFSQSNLGEDALAQIWDLSDINSTGQLSREEFAVAMFLIRQQRGNRTIPLPTVLPPNFVPPNMRGPRPQMPPQMTGAAGVSAYDAQPVAAPAPPPQPKSALDDLFGLDSPSASPAPPVSRDLPAGASATNDADPFSGGPSSPTRTAAGGASFKPFVPTSSFGRGLAPQPSGGSGVGSGGDLLSDDEPEETKKISGESTELANLSNQISSLAKQTQETQGKRTSTQNDLNQTNTQKQNFEQRLTQLRALYEKEAEETRALEDQLRKSQQETRKLQSDCMALEGSYADARTQHQEVANALQADQQENARLKERIRGINAEIAQLKPQIDKLKSEGRQQKGLVAINKKQLSTSEGERDKLKAEVDELSKLPPGIDDSATMTRAASPRAASPRAASPRAASPPVASPAASTTSGNNPFFRRTASTDIMGAFSGSAPPSRNVNEDSFDDVFGPHAPASTATPPPQPTPVSAFKQQNTGNSAASGGSGAPTPVTASPSISRQATLNVEPPAPPESRQISSSFLPFPDHPESLSSSRQVSPPASRGDTASATTDYQSHFPGPAVAAGAVTGVAAGAAVATASSPTTEVPGAFPGDDSDKQDTPSGIPAPADVTNPTAADGAPRAVSSSDPFASMDQAKAKEDFDNAFAAFSSSSTRGAAQEGSKPGADAVAKGKSFAFDAEFPPISELQRDDESDSDSDGGGFDDDFSPASPGNLKTDAPAPAPVPAPAPAPAAGAASAPTRESADKSTADGIFGKTDTTATGATGNNNASFDDLSDDFEGLEDAKEGSADDDFANISRSGLDDFNPMFDSPPPSQAKGESNPAATAAAASSAGFGGNSSVANESSGGSFDFISSAGSQTQKSNTADSHDWDAIFAGLDSSSSAAPGTAKNDATATTGGLAAPTAERPPGPGRALTEAGEHDDPMVKSLMDLGYSRPDAVSALEKYDYNLERAANHLANQS
ncbi:epidermal growth factor receptor substrate 15 [Geosmithia morbida]|uniref:Epidermal growth factor receptor substrate 15 n=1 Tax=Geosmithia morbida TaxID=1094350 RepID=A0A9P4Z1Q0_9HYPO|nr:epidermal growth factor receptor substrate 15 [Geosmithia morbida]KAF4125814.1 epidermal growth factor receptor substrate 15 [Geosmithia morbida]